MIITDIIANNSPKSGASIHILEIDSGKRYACCWVYNETLPFEILVGEEIPGEREDSWGAGWELFPTRKQAEEEMYAISTAWRGG